MLCFFFFETFVYKSLTVIFTSSRAGTSKSQREQPFLFSLQKCVLKK